MAKSFDVLCVGAVNHDVIATVDGLPGDDQRIIAEDILIGHGGPAAQAAVTLARLGHSVALSSSVGDDPEGKAIRDALSDEGVDVDEVRTVRGARTPRTVVLADLRTGNRSIVTSPYRSAPVDPPIERAGIVHVDQVGFAAVDRLLQEGRTGGQLSVDAGNPIPGFHLRDVWLYAPTRTALARDVVAQPEETQAALAERARRGGAEIVVVTDGARGSWWYDDTGEVHVPAHPVEVVSSLGAGDVFHGALVSALVDGKRGDDALLWANVCASMSCRAVDGRSAIPRRRQLEDAVATARMLSDEGIH